MRQIPPEKRGHRPKLHATEETAYYPLKVPVSLKRRAIKAGAPRVRAILDKHLPPEAEK